MTAGDKIKKLRKSLYEINFILLLQPQIESSFFICRFKRQIWIWESAKGETLTPKK